MIVNVEQSSLGGVVVNVGRLVGIEEIIAPICELKESDHQLDRHSNSTYLQSPNSADSTPANITFD